MNHIELIKRISINFKVGDWLPKCKLNSVRSFINEYHIATISKCLDETFPQKGPNDVTEDEVYFKALVKFSPKFCFSALQQIHKYYKNDYDSNFPAFKALKRRGEEYSKTKLGKLFTAEDGENNV